MTVDSSDKLAHPISQWEAMGYMHALEEAGIVLITDTDGLIIHVNYNFCVLAKYNREDLLGQHSRILSSAFHPAWFIREMWATIKSGNKWRGEMMNKTKDGSIFWSDITIFPLPDDAGVVRKYMAVLTDITAKRNAEEEVNRINAEKVIVFDRISDSVISVDNEWRYTFLNQAALTTHPLGLTETLGKVIWDVHPELKGTVFREKYLKAMSTREVQEIENYYAPMNTWFAAKVYPTADGLTMCYRDITASKLAEQEITRQSNLSGAVINGLPGIFYLYDRAGAFSKWNTNFETISGYSAEEISRMHPLDFFDTDEQEMLRAKIDRVFETGFADIEAHFFTKNKEKIPYYFTGHLSIFDGKEYLMGMGLDISERTSARRQLKTSEEQYRYLFNNNPAVIIIWDIHTMDILEVNNLAVELYGYSQEEFLSITVLELRPEAERELITEFANHMQFADNEIERRTWRHLKKSGDLMYMDIASHRIDYNNRKAILSLAKDITEQVMAEAELKETYEDIRRLNAHLQTIREDERTAIAREIHDELGQQLTGLKIDTSWLMKKIDAKEEVLHHKLAVMTSLMDDAVKTIRRISSDLRPGMLDDLGLVAALEWQSSEFEKRTGIICAFWAEDSELQPDGNIATGIFRIFQEALTNVARHAHATNVIAALVKDGGNLVMTVQDNGDGFDVAGIRNKKTLGLTGMRERTLMFNGILNIDSKPGAGTTIVVKIPVS